MKFLLYLIFILPIFAQANNCQWPLIKKIDQGSLVSTYTFHFWDFAKKSHLYFPKQLLQEGPVVGDYQFNNINIYFNPKVKKPQLAVSDLDDVGHGLLIADYVKYVSFLNEKYGDIKDKTALMFYLKGLKNEKLSAIETPENIKKVLLEKVNYFDQSDQSFVERKINNKKNKFEDKQNLLSLKNLSSSDEEALGQVYNQLKNIKTLDAGIKINESGSSINLIRILLLTSLKSDYSIYELKENRCSALMNYKPSLQKDVQKFKYKEYFNSENYWTGSSTIYVGHKTYLFRKKRQNQIESLNLESLNADEIQNYANYFSHYLGLLHSKSASLSYIEFLENNLKETSQAVKRMSIDYLVLLKSTAK